MPVRHKNRNRAPSGGKGKGKKGSGKKASQKKIAEEKGTFQELSSLPEQVHPSQASEAVIGFAKCLSELDLQQEKLSSNKCLLLQQSSSSPSLSSTATDSDQITSSDFESGSMSDKDNFTDKQQGVSAVEEPKSRSDAVTLLRSRTVSRSSSSEASALADSSLQSKAQGSAGDDLQSATAPQTQVTASEPATSSKKGKKKKSKKYKKVDLASIAPDAAHRRSSRTPSSQPSAEIPESQPPKKGGDICDTASSSVLKETPQRVDIPPSARETKTVDYSAAVKETNYHDKHAAQAEKNPQTKSAQAKEAVNANEDKEAHEVPARRSKSSKSDKKGKRRVARVDPVTGDEIPEDAQGSSSFPASNTPIADIEEGMKGITLDSSTNESSATSSAISTPPSRPGQSSRRTSSIHREKLSPIQEAAGDIDADTKNLTSEARSLLTSTPKSSTTAWSSFGPQATSQSEGSTAESTETGNRRQEVSVKSPRHTHPGSPAGGEQSTLAAASSQGSVSTQKPEGFFWQLDSHGFPCAKHGCDKRCNLWDGATVICPGCGPYSEVHYCCKEHMFEDVKYHWMYCGQMTFVHPCRESSIPRQVREGPIMIPCIHPYDAPERHRQAVRFSADTRAGDYFIFSDWVDYVEAGFPENTLDVRCPHRVLYAIKFDDPVEKDRFRRVLAICLFMTLDVHELVDFLFRLIRDKLRADGRDQELEVSLKYQFQTEFNVTIQETITGTRHACDTDWNGKNRRNCPDAGCRSEFRRLLGTPPGRGLGQMVDHLEGTYWILRTARTTHPSVTNIAARMRGEGFDQVADEDQRDFRRGDEWDGAGSGEREIEGINA
ncbi:uncharacterized protein KD926_007518 [Aspergillus affinis]|uniref:uncharacterized protein n=1 Tax=Aspergillus affinis TaxID=1070780 RepID=UPI0022FE66D9|nr:uncharacterized protein KD926_007518 [Aspergillus affinis]KAI9040977.1 hypothetical protein KD926_007518 [Aspergillus affinis]